MIIEWLNHYLNYSLFETSRVHAALSGEEFLPNLDMIFNILSWFIFGKPEEDR